MDGAHEGSRTLQTLQHSGLLTAVEVAAVHALLAPTHPFAGAVALAETVHLHVKMDDTHALPLNALFDAGARLDHQRDGFVKFRFPGDLNLIFSHIPVSQDDLGETPSTRRMRPFLDHIGVDLRRESANVRAAFDALPVHAAQLGWTHATQGGPSQPVSCCHSEVAEKHWIYPGDVNAEIALEFAYGALKVTSGASGCDLRPSDPRSATPANADGCPVPTNAASIDVGGGYFQLGDLQRFADITRVNPTLGQAFFGYYRQVLDEGLLSGREKALTALAIAHALKCPYNIEAYTETLFEMGVSEDEMSEAVHVASAMVAGITLVHSVQMMKKLDQLRGGTATSSKGCC